MTEKEFEKICIGRACLNCRFEKLCEKAVEKYKHEDLYIAFTKYVIYERKKKLEKLLEI